MEIIVILIVGISIVLPGFWMYYKPPKNINPLIGYRTKRSMKSQDAWDFATKYSAVKMIQSGIVYMLAVASVHILIPDFEWLFVAAIVVGSILVAIYVISATENQLKEKFPED